MQHIAERLSEQWEPLMSYFNSLPETHDDNGRKLYKLDKTAREKLKKIKCMLNNDKNRLKKIKCMLNNDKNRLFFKNYLLKFTTFNQYFQTTKPVAYQLIPKMNSLYKDVLTCFVDPRIINRSKDNLPDIDTLDSTNLLYPDDIWYGDVDVFGICGN